MLLTHLEDYIYELYNAIDISTPDQLSVHGIAKKLKVNVKYGAFDLRIDNIIFLSKSSPQEEWETFGHELGHYLRHHGNQMLMHLDFKVLQEYQADQFAYQFCVPTFMLQNYQLANYFNIEDGVPIIARDFNVTEDFARKRLIQFRNKILQAKSDEEHRKFMERLYPKAPPYSEETMKVMEELSAILYKKGLNK